MALQTTVEQVEGPVPVTIVALDGELDASSYERVIDTVRQIYDAGGRQPADGPDRAWRSSRAPASWRCTPAYG